MGCYIKNDWCEIRKKYLILTSTYLLKKDWEEEFLTFVNDMIKQIINTYDYDPKKPSIFISYLDMNNLYGWAMSRYLHYEGLKWLRNVDEFDVMSINETSAIAYFLEVDLQYCDELHELHNDYPLPPEKLAVSSDVKKMLINMRWKLVI